METETVSPLQFFPVDNCHGLPLNARIDILFVTSLSNDLQFFSGCIENPINLSGTPVSFTTEEGRTSVRSIAYLLSSHRSPYPALAFYFIWPRVISRTSVPAAVSSASRQRRKRPRLIRSGTLITRAISLRTIFPYRLITHYVTGTRPPEISAPRTKMLQIATVTTIYGPYNNETPVLRFHQCHTFVKSRTHLSLFISISGRARSTASESAFYKREFMFPHAWTCLQGDRTTVGAGDESRK